MNYDAVIVSAVRDLPFACEFQRLFPAAEHTVVKAKRHTEPEGWKLENEWISRACLHDRYVVWLVAAIEIAADNTVSALEEPDLYVIEPTKVKKGRDQRGGPKFEYGYFQFEEGAWDELVRNGGDFASLGLEMILDAPVKRFDTFWRDTRPGRLAVPPPDGIALRAPFRFAM